MLTKLEQLCAVELGSEHGEHVSDLLLASIIMAAVHDADTYVVKWGCV